MNIIQIQPFTYIAPKSLNVLLDKFRAIWLWFVLPFYPRSCQISCVTKTTSYTYLPLFISQLWIKIFLLLQIFLLFLSFIKLLQCIWILMFCKCFLESFTYWLICGIKWAQCHIGKNFYHESTLYSLHGKYFFFILVGLAFNLIPSISVSYALGLLISHRILWSSSTNNVEYFLNTVHYYRSFDLRFYGWSSSKPNTTGSSSGILNCISLVITQICTGVES